MLTPHSGASGTYTFPYTVRDPVGATASSTLTINICSATIQSVIPSSVVVNPNGSLASMVTVTISHNGFCDPLVLGFLPSALQAVESPEPFNVGTSVELGANEYVWTVPSGPGNAVKKRVVTLNLRQGANGPIEDTDSLETKDR